LHVFGTHQPDAPTRDRKPERQEERPDDAHASTEFTRLRTARPRSLRAVPSAVLGALRGRFAGVFESSPAHTTLGA
jgi:hypothetical protein